MTARFPELTAALPAALDGGAAAPEQPARRDAGPDGAEARAVGFVEQGVVEEIVKQVIGAPAGDAEEDAAAAAGEDGGEDDRGVRAAEDYLAGILKDVYGV
ncbi:MAG: hypothetical protein VX113_08935, partial [Pseudomonadota bacterium]|nr:hypothetical protein [Pseudomonadota bacterium]